MKGGLKTTFDDAHSPNVETESRPFTVHDETCEHPSSIIWWIYCPFCGDEIRAYLWSLAGGGKRCECGAIFSARGMASRRVETCELADCGRPLGHEGDHMTKVTLRARKFHLPEDTKIDLGPKRTALGDLDNVRREIDEDTGAL